MKVSKRTNEETESEVRTTQELSLEEYRNQKANHNQAKLPEREKRSCGAISPS